LNINCGNSTHDVRSVETVDAQRFPIGRAKTPSKGNSLSSGKPFNRRRNDCSKLQYGRGISLHGAPTVVDPKDPRRSPLSRSQEEAHFIWSAERAILEKLVTLAPARLANNRASRVRKFRVHRSITNRGEPFQFTKQMSARVELRDLGLPEN
jgi:hypothetical protein